MMRYSLGVDELDELLGGVEPGSVIVIEGSPGSGKTTFALSIVYKNVMTRGAKALYISLGETPEKLIGYAKGLGFNVEPLVSSGVIKLVRLPVISGKDMIEFISKLLSEEITKRSIIVIDSVTPLMKMLESHGEKRAWIQTVVYDMFSKLCSLLILVADTFSPEDADLKLLEFVADIVLELRYRIHEYGTIERFIQVKKFRGRGIRVWSIPFTISSRGITVLNYVTRSLIESSRKDRKKVKVQCPAVQKLINSDTVEPGMQILILDRRKWMLGAYFIEYLAHALIELVNRGFNIAIESFDPDVLSVLHKLLKDEGLNQALGTRLKIVEFDPRTTSLSYLVEKDLCDIVRNGSVDIYVVLGLERVADIYGLEMLKRFAINITQNLRDIGITTIRYYRIGERNEAPAYYVDWSDIVVELATDSRGRTTLRVLKNLRIGAPIEIHDDEFERCIKQNSV